MLPNWGSASTVSNSSAGTDAGDEFMMEVDIALNALSDEAPSVNLSDAVTDEALLEETASRVFAAEWSVAEQLYPPLNGGAAYQNCLFTVNVCFPAGQSACADAPRFAVKAMRHRFQELPEATQTRVRREVAIMRALDSDFTVRLAERPYVNGGIVYLVRCAAGKPPAQARERVSDRVCVARCHAPGDAALPVQLQQLPGGAPRVGLPGRRPERADGCAPHSVRAAVPARHARRCAPRHQVRAASLRRAQQRDADARCASSCMLAFCRSSNILLRDARDLATCVLADVGHSRQLLTGQAAHTSGLSLGTEGCGCCALRAFPLRSRTLTAAATCTVRPGSSLPRCSRPPRCTRGAWTWSCGG